MSLWLEFSDKGNCNAFSFFYIFYHSSLLVNADGKKSYSKHTCIAIFTLLIDVRPKLFDQCNLSFICPQLYRSLFLMTLKLPYLKVVFYYYNKLVHRSLRCCLLSHRTQFHNIQEIYDNQYLICAKKMCLVRNQWK